MISSLASLAPAGDRCLPVDEALASLLPDPGLQRGRVIGCTGPAAMSLALGLASRSVMVGSWLAVVGVPMLGVEAAAQFGLPLSRLVMVDSPGPAAGWAERVGAAADGFDIVLTRPPAGAERVLRKVRTRLQARGVVLITVGPASQSGSQPGSQSGSQPVSCDLEFTTTSVEWDGIGQGAGHLTARRAIVRSGGRRMPRPVELELWLPGPDGRVASCARDPSGLVAPLPFIPQGSPVTIGRSSPVGSRSEHNSQLPTGAALGRAG